MGELLDRAFTEQRLLDAWRERSDGNDRSFRPGRLAGAMKYVVTYDIADDRRREDVATLLSGLRAAGPAQRVRVRVPHPPGGAALQGKLRDLIDPVEDQVRLYPLDDRAARRVAVIGARMIEERQDFWIVT